MVFEELSEIARLVARGLLDGGRDIGEVSRWSKSIKFVHYVSQFFR